MKNFQLCQKVRQFYLYSFILLLVSLTVTTASADSNVTLNQPVSLNGTFFTGGWGSGQVVPPATIVDNYFYPVSTQWDQGAVWWDASYGPQFIEIDLGGIRMINRFIVQADDNDTYRISYYDLTNSIWKPAWDIPAPVVGACKPVPIRWALPL